MLSFYKRLCNYAPMQTMVAVADFPKSPVIVHGYVLDGYQFLAKLMEESVGLHQIP